MAYDGTHCEVPSIAEVKAHGLGILAACGCGHSRVLDPARVCASPAIDVVALGSLLRCSKCGAKDLATSPAPLLGADRVRDPHRGR